ncbi:MAG: hypothetical protein F6K04_18055 [Leptolyngbya sp. SIO4C5]|nr:hypothetical protein [Leptolyngbya sp. SIO4C5]
MRCIKFKHKICEIFCRGIFVETVSEEVTAVGSGAIAVFSTLVEIVE